MAVKDIGKAEANALRKRGPAPDAKRSAADKYNGYAAIGTVVGWIMLLLGQRVLDAEEGASQFFTALALVALVSCFGQRIWAVMAATGSRKSAAAAMAILNGLGLVALGLFWATTDAGREMLAVAKPLAGQSDSYTDVLTVTWVSLLAVSLLPSILAELARRSMLRAEAIESRRIVAAVVSGVAVAFALIYGSLFTYGASKVEWQADFSYFRVAKPSAATVRMLDSLQEPMKVLVFFPTHSEARTKVVRYLEELRSKTAKLEFEVHDRLLVPELAKEHKVRKDGQLVLVRDKMSQTLDIGKDDGPKTARTLKKLDGEFQKVLLKAMRDKRTVYLTVGHGELNEETDRKSMRTVRLLRQLMESQNYTIKNLGLSQGLGNAAPDDADVILVLGPTEPLSEGEIESLRRYAEGGGRLLLALDPDAKADMQPLAAVAGVQWQQAIVINDKVLYRMKRNDSDKKILVAKRFSSHASVSTLSKLAARGAAVLIPGAAPLDKIDAKDKGFKIDFAVKSVPGSYVDLNGNWAFDKGAEKKATYNLVAAVTSDVIPSEGDDSKPKATPPGDKLEMRAVVIGDADVFTDPVMDFAKTNRLLFLELLRWLGGEESFSGEISEEEDVPIVHTKSEDQVWFYTAIVGVPSLVVGAGLLLTRRRRRKPTRSKPKNKARATGDEPDGDEPDGDEPEDEADAEDEDEADAEDEDEADAEDEDEDEADAEDEDEDEDEDEEGDA